MGISIKTQGAQAPEGGNKMTNTEMTNKQSELWKLANGILAKAGGMGSINRNPDRAIRESGKTPGTRNWALLKSTGLASGIVPDDECQYLIDCINQF